MSDTLDKWEAEAKELQNIWERNLNPTQAQCCERILTLIDLIRKKDRALKHGIAAMSYAYEDHVDNYYLTEDLGKEAER